MSSKTDIEECISVLQAIAEKKSFHNFEQIEKLCIILEKFKRQCRTFKFRYKYPSEKRIDDGQFRLNIEFCVINKDKLLKSWSNPSKKPFFCKINIKLVIGGIFTSLDVDKCYVICGQWSNNWSFQNDDWLDFLNEMWQRQNGKTFIGNESMLCKIFGIDPTN